MSTACVVDGQAYSRLYNDAGDVPPQPEVERAYRDAFLAAAREAAAWDFPDVDAIQLAWQERREARRRAEVTVTSAQLFGDSSFDEFEPPGTHIVYRPGHEVDAARTRGRVHAFEQAKWDWWDLADLGLDDEEIRREFMRPWLDAVAAWAAGPLETGGPPPRPLDAFTAAQWRLVLAKQQGRELVFECVENAEAHLRSRHGPWTQAWDCRDEAGEILGRVFRWQRLLGDVVRLAARQGQRWSVYEDGPGTPHAVAKRLVAVTREQLEWLWPGRVPLGKLTLLAGDPGLGKSFVTLDMAARVSRGQPWPDAPVLPQAAGDVVLLNAEDDLADTIAPRLDKAGADDTRIVAIEGVAGPTGRRHFSLKTDLPRLQEVLQANPHTRLVIIDPIDAYCDHVDSHKSAEVRGLLAPLAELAGRYRVAIVAVTHLSKTGGTKAIYRAMGSLAFAAAARSVWMIVKGDVRRRLFLPAKLNVGGEPDGLAYHIEDGRVVWEAAPVRMHADDAFAAEAAASEPGRGAERREAIAWLREQLAGGPVPASDVIELGGQFGFNERTLQRAFKLLGGVRKREGFHGRWTWELPHVGDSTVGDTNRASF